MTTNILFGFPDMHKVISRDFIARVGELHL